MEPVTQLANRGFSFKDVTADDLGAYLAVKQACYQKYVDKYYGG